jgi:hypothetical protein
MVAPCGKFTKASLAYLAVAVIFFAVAVSPSRGDTILLNDTFNSPTQIGLNQDLNTRQTGTFAPMNYGSTGSEIYVSPNGNNTLWVLGQSDGEGAPTSANGIVWAGTNFNQNPGAGGYISVSADIFPSQNNPGNPSWLGLTIASGNMDSSPVSNVSQLGTIFRGNSYFEAYDSGSFITGSTTQYNSNDTVAHHVEFRISDPTDGNPWNGSGETAIALYVDRSASPLWSFTKTGGGYTNNQITLWANANAGQTIIHQVDNFNVTSVIAVPEPGSLTIVGTALFGFVAYARRKRMTPA